MLGANFKEVGWPRSGEIDIMELVGQDDDRVFGTVHWDNNGSKAQYPTSGGGFEVADEESFSNQYHVFSLEWSESELEWFVDGVRYQSFEINEGAGLDAFRKAFFLIFNIAVGGNLPGSPNSDTQFPQYMHVDYVRVYQGS
jgi:beta-glucanase (GH16 family)